MAEPVVTQEALVEAGKHVAGTAGGGGLVAVIIEFFRGRERAQLQQRVAALEATVAILVADLNALAPRHWSSADGALTGRRTRRRTAQRTASKKK
jgi:hypothetical protein